MDEDIRKHNGCAEKVEENEFEEMSAESNAALAGQAGRRILQWILDKAKKIAYGVAAFTGGLAKSFFFGEPNPQANFFGEVSSWMKSKTYPSQSTEFSKTQQTQGKEYPKESQTQTNGKQQREIPIQNISVDVDENLNEKSPQKNLSDNKKDFIHKIRETLIPMGFGGYLTDGKLNIAAIDKQGNIDSNIYTVDTNCFNEKSNPQSLAAAIFQIKHENLTVDPDSCNSKEFDDAVMRSNIMAAIISLNMVDGATVEGTMQTTMGPLSYSAHVDGDINVPSTSYYFKIDGKEAVIPVNKDINQEITSTIQDFRENPPQHSFTIEERKGKEIQVDWERGNPEFFVKVVIDGEVKHEDSYVAQEAPQSAAQGDRKTLTDFVYDLGRGKLSKVPEWSAHDSPSDKKSSWISSTAAAYTIAGIVNPSGMPSINKKDPDKFFSLIHAGKSWYIDANTAHMSIDFSNGEPKFVTNHGKSGYLYMDANIQNPTETAKQIEELRRAIVGKDPSEAAPILSPQDGRSPSGYIVEAMRSNSPEITSPVMFSMIGGQICTETSMYINEHKLEAQEEQSIQDIAERTDEKESLIHEGLSNEEFARRTEAFLANTLKVVGADEIGPEPDNPELLESNSSLEYDINSLDL